MRQSQTVTLLFSIKFNAFKCNFKKLTTKSTISASQQWLSVTGTHFLVTYIAGMVWHTFQARLCDCLLGKHNALWDGANDGNLTCCITLFADLWSCCPHIKVLLFLITVWLKLDMNLRQKTENLLSVTGKAQVTEALTTTSESIQSYKKIY